jgi:hypothetical protein
VKTILGVSDLQVPYQHKRAVSALTKFVKATGSPTTSCVGDEIDMPMISAVDEGHPLRVRGQAAQAPGPDGPDPRRTPGQARHARSNHSDRLGKYLNTYAPGLADEPELQLERYMRYADLGITFHRQPVGVRPRLAARPRRRGRAVPGGGQDRAQAGAARRQVVVLRAHPPGRRSPLHRGVRRQARPHASTAWRSAASWSWPRPPTSRAAAPTGSSPSAFFVDGKHVSPAPGLHAPRRLLRLGEAHRGLPDPQTKAHPCPRPRTRTSPS